MFDDRIVVGCYVNTPSGKAVCIGIEAPSSEEADGQRLIRYRYKAIRVFDGAILWVENADMSGSTKEYVQFLAPPTRYTAPIVKLTGPYGIKP